MNFEEYYNHLNPEIKEYFKTLSPVFPRFLKTFIETKTMMRLKEISYFCGMEYASKEIYHFKYYLSRLDHSISTALITWNFTYDEKASLAALFHDASTPAFSHVIDYMNGDFINEESTELSLESIFNQDEKLMHLLKVNGLKLEDVCHYKNYPLVDNARPKLCADRLDSIFLANLVWLNKTNLTEIKTIYQDLIIKKNENNEEEFSFISPEIADLVVYLNDNINYNTHLEDDFNSMLLLALMTKRLIKLKVITYEDLYTLTDQEVMSLIIDITSEDEKLASLYQEFISLTPTFKECSIPVKDKKINPLVLSKRLSTF